MYDKIEEIGGSTIQHNKSNNRIDLMKLAAADYGTITGRLEEISGQNGYTKIFTKIPSSAAHIF